MSKEILVPNMTKKGKYRPKKHIGLQKFNILLVFVGLLILIFSSFIALPIKHFILSTQIFSSNTLFNDDYIFKFVLIPQIPIIFFLYSVLRKRLAMATVILYILLGLFFIPIFAMGGGIKYVAQFGFGYLLAFIPTIFVINKIYHKKDSILNALIASILGVLIIHVIGIFYMILVALIKHAGGDFIKIWIISQSGLKIVYDIIFSFVLMLIGKPLHYGIKFLTSK